MGIYEAVTNVLLKAIAYKFEVKATIFDVIGLRDGRMNLARCLSKAVAQESPANVRDLQEAIEIHGYNVC